MQVRDLMHASYPVIAPGDKVRDALNALARHNSRHAIVIEDERVLGIVSEWDVLRAHVRGALDQAVRDAMTLNVHTVQASDSIDVIMTRFLDERHTCFPVVDKGRSVGIIAISDVLAALANGNRPPKRKRASARSTSPA